jgi:hypothetical protein
MQCQRVVIVTVTEVVGLIWGTQATSATITRLKISSVLLLNSMMGLDDISNIAIPCGPNASTCGYCSPPGQRSKIATSYHSASLEAIKLSCEVRFSPSPVLSSIEALHDRFTKA